MTFKRMQKDTKIKVLIVEDEPTIAQDIAFNLEDHGFEVAGMAMSSDKALDILYKKNVDIALLDISIQGTKNGIELAHLINEKYQIPFVFLTSFSDQDTIQKAADTYPEGYLVKPFKDSDLAPALNVALAKHNRSKEDGLPTLEVINTNLEEEISESEYRVIEAVWNGKKNYEISDQLFISVNTVKSHLSKIYQKLKVNSKPLLIQRLREIYQKG